MARSFFSGWERQTIRDADPVNAALRHAAKVYLYEASQMLTSSAKGEPAAGAREVVLELEVAGGLAQALHDRMRAQAEAKEAEARKQRRRPTRRKAATA